MMDTIGQQLKQAREARNLTIEQVVEATRIRANHIAAMEADDFEALPSPVQARGFLRLYAGFLKLSLDDLIANQRSASQAAPSTPPDQASPRAEPEEAVPAREASPAIPSTESIHKRVLASLQAGLRETWSELKGLLEKSGAAVQTKLSPGIPAAGEPARLTPAESGQAEPPEEGVAESAAAAAPPPIAPQSPQAQAIFAAIGKQLQTRRESLSLTLEEIERHTRVRIHYLEALERGDLRSLPSSVQARGMLNNYAHFLDMDVDAILLQFADGLRAQFLERQSRPAGAPSSPGLKTRFHLPARIQIPSSLRKVLSPDLLVGGGLILFLIIFAIWATARVVDLRASQVSQPTAPFIGEIPVGSPEITATPSPATSTASVGIIPAGGATQAIAIPTGGQGRVHVVVVALGSTWVRVSVDGRTKFEGRVTPGTPYLYDGNTQIEVLTGDGSAVSIIHNQNDLGPMGTFGEVVDRIYTVDAVLSPTATFTPTFTRTPVPSATPRASPTPRRSPTPTVP